ncbi:MAG: sensor histidine kinase, partial [Actinomycetia bacterium]|nr:sensor histidine kinase [Actinomycetes bacterium]
EKQVHETSASLDVAEQLHDGLGHSISVMTMQAGAARMSLQDQDSPAASALEIVEEKGREALAELDRVLEVLDDPAVRTDKRQAAGLAGIEHLVEGVRHSGLDVNLTIDDSTPLGGPLEATAYDVVREALTNVVKHGGAEAGPVEVSVTSDDAGLAIVVTNAGDCLDEATAGRGIMGMRKRVEVYGGSFDAEPRSEGGFAVTATIPQPEDSGP